MIIFLWNLEVTDIFSLITLCFFFLDIFEECEKEFKDLLEHSNHCFHIFTFECIQILRDSSMHAAFLGLRSALILHVRIQT